MDIESTKLRTYEYGRWRNVYKEKGTGKLFFKCDRHLHGTFIEHCKERMD